MPSICLSNGVTSLVDAGREGVDRIEEIVATAKGAPNRVRILLNIARTGILPDGELNDISRVDVEAAQKVIARHRRLIVGVKRGCRAPWPARTISRRCGGHRRSPVR